MIDTICTAGDYFLWVILLPFQIGLTAHCLAREIFAVNCCGPETLLLLNEKNSGTCETYLFPL